MLRMKLRYRGGVFAKILTLLAFRKNSSGEVSLRMGWSDQPDLANGKHVRYHVLLSNSLYNNRELNFGYKYGGDFEILSQLFLTMFTSPYHILLVGIFIAFKNSQI